MPDDEIPGRRLAVAAEALYLTNLLLAPGLAFVAIALLWRRHRQTASRLARNHLRQAFLVSLWGGVLIVAVTAALLLFVDNGGALWTAVILYFTCIHSTLVLFGIVGLARAMAGQNFRYPLIGPRLLENEHD